MNRSPDNGNPHSSLDERRAAALAPALELLAELVERWPGPAASPAYRAARDYAAGLTIQRGPRLCEVLTALRAITSAWPALERSPIVERAHTLAWERCRACAGDPAPRRLRKNLCRECYRVFAAEPRASREADRPAARAAGGGELAGKRWRRPARSPTRAA